ncbi:MAG: hypothetical protein ACK46X_16225, partial [Candidatus Sericytochromatia bacterium]
PGAAAALVLTVEAQPEPAAAGYRTQYVRVIDWEVAEASLTNSDGAIAAMNRSVPVSVSADLARTASLYFAPIQPAGDYTLSIALKRRDRAGTYQTVASGTRTGITLAPGTNTASVTLSTTTAGQVSISAPAPSLTAPTPPEISVMHPMSASVGMLLGLAGVNLAPTPAGNELAINGVVTPILTGGASWLAAEITGAHTSGPVTVAVAGRTATSPTGFTLVPSGSPTCSAGVGASPAGMALDGAGALWVANAAGTTLTRLSLTGEYQSTHYAGAAPIAVAIHGSGTLWVANHAASGTVTRLSSSGAVLGSTAVGPYPNDIAFDSAGQAWVTNTGDNTVTRLSSAGVALSTHTVGVSPSHAVAVAIDGTGHMWVAEPHFNRLVKLAPDGSVAGTYSTGNTPSDVAIDGAGAVWVSCAGAHVVQKLPPGGGAPTSYATGAGSAPGKLAFDPQGNLWVCCEGTDRVLKLSPGGAILGTYAPGGNPSGIAFDLFRSANVSLSNTNTVVRLAL